MTDFIPRIDKFMDALVKFDRLPISTLLAVLGAIYFTFFPWRNPFYLAPTGSLETTFAFIFFLLTFAVLLGVFSKIFSSHREHRKKRATQRYIEHQSLLDLYHSVMQDIPPSNSGSFRGGRMITSAKKVNKIRRLMNAMEDFGAVVFSYEDFENRVDAWQLHTYLIAMENVLLEGDSKKISAHSQSYFERAHLKQEQCPS